MDLKEARNKKSNQRHPWELSRYEIVTNLLGNQLQAINQSNGILLDLGCGDTWFVEKLAHQYPGIHCIAVDIAFEDSDIAELREKYKGGNISIYKTLDEAQKDVNGTVNIVLLLDVIEHIEDDISFLKWVQTFPCIDAETIFAITVPAYQWLFASHDIFLDHYRRYTNSLLISNTAKAGLHCYSAGYFFFSLYLARILAVIKEKIMGRKNHTTGLVEWQGGKFVTQTIKAVLMTDYFVTSMLRKIGIKIPGLSNYGLCKKSV